MEVRRSLPPQTKPGGAKTELAAIQLGENSISSWSLCVSPIRRNWRLGDLFCVKAVGRPADGFPNFFFQDHFYFAVSAIRYAGKCVRCAVATKKLLLEKGQEMRCQNPATLS